MTKDIKQILNDYKEETKRHFGIVAEDIKDKIKIVSEQVAVNTEKITAVERRLEGVSEQVAVNTEKITAVERRLEGVSEQVAVNTEKITAVEKRLEGHDKRFENIDATLQIIKVDIEFIKNELKQKVSREEFAVLERRVSLLEGKLNKSR